jgi:hypothetical protein
MKMRNGMRWLLIHSLLIIFITGAVAYDEEMLTLKESIDVVLRELGGLQ